MLDDTNSNFGTQSYMPSWNMFQNADRKGLLDKEALAREIQGETSEVVKESSACCGWVVLCWILTFWVPNLLLIYVGRTWQEKLTLNILIWFVCACAFFVIAFLGNVICPTEHIFSTSELQSHPLTLSPNHHIQCRCDFYDIPQIGQYLLSCWIYRHLMLCCEHDIVCCLTVQVQGRHGACFVVSQYGYIRNDSFDSTLHIVLSSLLGVDQLPFIRNKVSLCPFHWYFGLFSQILQ